MPRLFRPLLAFSALAVVLLLAGCLALEEARREPEQRVAPTPVPTTAAVFRPPQSGPAVGGGSPVAGPTTLGQSARPGVVDPADVVARVQPAVVTVVTEQAAGFGRGQALEAGRGTGFIISADGYVVTNEHVVRDGNRFEVILASGEKRPAEVIGTDRLSDLAVVQIQGELPGIVAFGDSDALRPGQPVLAIGSPLGEFTGTVTDGIVSALNRDFPGSLGQGEGIYTDLIQHNAAINPGNSGGPLFDLEGRVIGVNTLGIPQTPGGVPAQGLFFAIPSNTVQQIVAQLIEQGRVRYPFLGIEYAPVVPEVAAVNELPVDYGAYLSNVVPGGPAAEAGLRPGDIIVAVGDQRIDAQTQFTEALFAYQPGATVPVTVQRGREQLQVDVTLAERPQTP